MGEKTAWEVIRKLSDESEFVLGGHDVISDKLKVLSAKKNLVVANADVVSAAWKEVIKQCDISLDELVGAEEMMNFVVSKYEDVSRQLFDVQRKAELALRSKDGFRVSAGVQSADFVGRVRQMAENIRSVYEISRKLSSRDFETVPREVLIALTRIERLSEFFSRATDFGEAEAILLKLKQQESKCLALAYSRVVSAMRGVDFSTRKTGSGRSMAHRLFLEFRSLVPALRPFIGQVERRRGLSDRSLLPELFSVFADVRRDHLIKMITEHLDVFAEQRDSLSDFTRQALSYLLQTIASEHELASQFFSLADDSVQRLLIRHLQSLCAPVYLFLFSRQRIPDGSTRLLDEAGAVMSTLNEIDVELVVPHGSEVSLMSEVIADLRAETRSRVLRSQLAAVKRHLEAAYKGEKDKKVMRKKFKGEAATSESKEEEAEKGENQPDVLEEERLRAVEQDVQKWTKKADRLMSETFVQLDRLNLVFEGASDVRQDCLRSVVGVATGFLSDLAAEMTQEGFVLDAALLLLGNILELGKRMDSYDAKDRDAVLSTSPEEKPGARSQTKKWRHVTAKDISEIRLLPNAAELVARHRHPFTTALRDYDQRGGPAANVLSSSVLRASKEDAVFHALFALESFVTAAAWKSAPSVLKRAHAKAMGTGSEDASDKTAVSDVDAVEAVDAGRFRTCVAKVGVQIKDVEVRAAAVRLLKEVLSSVADL